MERWTGQSKGVLHNPTLTKPNYPSSRRYPTLFVNITYDVIHENRGNNETTVHVKCLIAYTHKINTLGVFGWG